MKMHCFSTPLIAFLQILLLASFGAAVIIPEGLPDGLYNAALDPLTADLKAGSTFQMIKSHDQILAESDTSALPNEESTGSTLASLPRRSILQRRQEWLECNREHRDLVRGQIDVAVFLVGFSAWTAGRTVPYWNGVFYKYKTAVVYMCCYNWDGCTAWGWEMNAEDRKLTDRCGRTRVAHSHLRGVEKAYGRDMTGYRVCGGQFPLP